MSQSKLNLKWAICVSGLVIGAFSTSDAQQYELLVPSTGVRSTAVRSSSALTITDSRGQRTIYQRESRYDSSDRRYIGYYSRTANQIIGFPASEQGSMMIGTAGLRGTDYRASQMQVRRRQTSLRPGTGLPLGGINIGGGLQSGLGGGGQSALGSLFGIGSVRNATYLRLTTLDARPIGYTLSIGRGGVAAMMPSVAAETWQLIPLGRYYRVQCYYSGRAYSLCVGNTMGITLEPTRQDSRQFWYANALQSNPNAVTLESVFYPGRMLAGGRDGIVALERPGVVDAQVWLMHQFQPPVAFVPTRRLVNHEVRAVPPVMVSLELANLHRRELWVLVQDRRPGGPSHRVKIAAGRTVPIRLERDGGATLIETYETIDPLSGVRTESFSTTVPPKPIYDVSVYEMIAQSVSIDGTARGGGRIDDVNYQPKSLGYFPLPADLKPVQLDVFTLASEARNPGGVRRIDPRNWSRRETPLDPVERLLQDRGNLK